MTSPSRYKYRQSGFTIVELLIVIVVIGILAAITIVAYGGIQQRARVASLQSDLRSTVTTLATYSVTNNDQYPSDLASANLKSSPGTSYQYSVNNSVNPATYCITATNGSTSYYINNTTAATATAGGCPGDGVGGVAAITNLATNPAATSTNSVEWLTRYGMSLIWVTGASDGPTPTLKTYSRESQGAAITGSGRGIDHRGNIDLVTSPSDTAWPVTIGVPITASVYVRSSVANTALQLVYRLHNGSGTWLSGQQICGSPINYTGNTWVRLTCTFTPSSSGYVFLTSRFQQSVTWATGATIDGTGLLITSGSTVYDYADGSSPSWIWNGTPNNSTSTGPVL